MAKKTTKPKAVKPSKPAAVDAASAERVTSDFPKMTLRDALQISEAIESKNGGRGMPPTDLAIAIGKSPGSSTLRVLLSASAKYGLSIGAHTSERIEIRPLGQRIAMPESVEDKQAATLEAAFTPQLFASVYESFRGKKLPEAQFFASTLVREFQIPREHTARFIEIFTDNLELVGLVRKTPTGRWLSSDRTPVPESSGGGKDASIDEDGALNGGSGEPRKPPAAPAAFEPVRPNPPAAVGMTPEQLDSRMKRVFVTHGKNHSFVPQLKELLTFGGFEPVVSVERESVSKPVPDKVMDDMRSCGAAIIHVDAEREVMTPEGQKEVILNQNVLIEIGASMALYRRRFILLVQTGVRLPSNLQGLYEVRYEGEKLDGEATLRLLKAFNDFKATAPAAS